MLIFAFEPQTLHKIKRQQKPYLPIRYFLLIFSLLRLFCFSMFTFSDDSQTVETSYIAKSSIHLDASFRIHIELKVLLLVNLLPNSI